jgi:hypothetical protein
MFLYELTDIEDDIYLFIVNATPNIRRSQQIE